MDAIRRGLLRAADQVTMAGLHAGKFFGFLGSGRDLIQIDQGASGPVVCFHDHTDEGWPGFSVPIPPDAEFRYAASGPLSRVALWQSVQPEQQVLDDLGSREDGVQFSNNAEGVAEARFTDSVSLRVKGIRNGTTAVIVQQVREPEIIETVIRARTASWKRGA